MAEAVAKENGGTSLQGRHDDRGAPRGAARRRDRREAEFFSFGTNDLTQMTLGFSRDDAGVVPAHVCEGASPVGPVRDPRPTAWASSSDRRRGRPATRPDIKLGICGEHGGDPASIAFCHRPGSTTSPVRRTGCRSPASRPRRRRSGERRRARRETGRSLFGTPAFCMPSIMRPSRQDMSDRRSSPFMRRGRER